MADVQGVQVGQSFEELVEDDFFLEVGHLAHGVALDSLVQVLLVVSHGYVEVLIFVLPGHVGAEDFTDEVVI